MREPPRITRIACESRLARKTPSMMTRNLASMSSKKPRTSPATAPEKKGDGSSSPETVVVPEVTAAEAICRDEPTKQASETMGEMIAERWANSEMQMVMEKIMASNNLSRRRWKCRSLSRGLNFEDTPLEMTELDEVERIRTMPSRGVLH